VSYAESKEGRNIHSDSNCFFACAISNAFSV